MLAEAIIGHLVGDYIFQNDWMAQNKKKSSWPCLIHCTVWTGCVCLFAGWGWLPALVLFAFHFAQDRTEFIRWWMNLWQPGFAKPPLAPWSLIVVDNVFHLVQIWLVAEWIA